MRQSLTNSTSVYNEGENNETEGSDFKNGSQGRTKAYHQRGGSGNDIFYASMDKNATMGSHHLAAIPAPSEPKLASSFGDNQQ
jgi:hypothetical protein